MRDPLPWDPDLEKHLHGFSKPKDGRTAILRASRALGDGFTIATRSRFDAGFHLLDAAERCYLQLHDDAIEQVLPEMHLEELVALQQILALEIQRRV